MFELKYNSFVNEEMSTISSRKLRDAMHDIIVELKPKETMDVEEMSDRLLSEYKITISPFFLDKFLDDFLKVRKGEHGNRSFFTKQDARWLGVREVSGTKEMRNNLLYLKPSLSKHKRKLFAEEEKIKLDDAYKSGMKDLNFQEDVLKKSLVLQKPSDSEDIMKIIYNDIVFQKKYDNTYDNCWKLMMLIGRQNKLDRIRGWFKLAPQSVREEYFKGKDGQRKINYDLTKPKTTTTSKTENPKKEPVDIKTKENLKKVDNYLIKYHSWNEFIRNVNLKELISMIDELKPMSTITSQNIDFNKFVSKVDELNLILIKYYRVGRLDVINFYKNIGLDKFLRDWEKWKSRGAAYSINVKSKNTF